MKLGLDGKTAFVSGAHRGTGAVIARLLAEEGMQVIVHGPAPGDADATVGELRSAGHDAIAAHGDLTTDEGADAAIAACEGGPVDVLINNWGGVAPGRWKDSDPGTWHADYERNVLSMVRLSIRLSDGMKARGVITPFHYVPLHSAPAGQRFGRAEGPMDVTDRISETLVRLPMFFDLGSEIEAVIDIAQEVLTEIGVAS